MGNNIGGRKKTKVMKINGKTIVKDVDTSLGYTEGLSGPCLVQQDLKPKKIYFLVELPKFPDEDKAPRTVRSGGIQMSAKDRLECLMLSRRSVSDVSMVRQPLMSSLGSGSGRMMTVKKRLQKKMKEEDEIGVAVV